MGVKKEIYQFGSNTDGDGSMIIELGGKGAKLAEMALLGLNVPSGITIPTNHCVTYLNAENDFERNQLLTWLVDIHVLPALELIAEEKGYMPLFSVRSGARISMAGMMDTVLNVGITSENSEEWIERLGQKTYTDCLRRLQTMYNEVVFGIDGKAVSDHLEQLKLKEGVAHDSELTVQSIANNVLYAKKCAQDKGHAKPDNLREQLIECISSVFESWNNPRAKYYRKLNNIPDDWGTAVNIQSMVFGNMNDNSGSGVLFSVDPSTGEWDYHEIVGEYLSNAQGEDVVAGIRTPEELGVAIKNKNLAAKTYLDLVHNARKLELHFKDIQDIEFTVEDGTLYFLQTRDAKRTPQAAVRFADLALDCGFWDPSDAIKKLTPYQVANSISPVNISGKKAHYRGIAAGGSIVGGVPAFSVADVKDIVNSGKKAILVADETTPEDIEGIDLSVGVLTIKGGLTSHAAVVARGMNTTCVVGCTDLSKAWVMSQPLITLDGLTGEVFEGEVEVKQGDLNAINCILDSLGVEMKGTPDGVAVVDFTDDDQEYVLDIVEELEKQDPDINVILLYRTHRHAALDWVIGSYIPPELGKVACWVNHGWSSHQGRYQVMTDIDMSELTKTFDNPVVIQEPRTVDDLLSMEYAKVSDTILDKLFGSTAATTTILNALKNSGVSIAKEIEEPEHPIKCLCKYLLESK